MDRKLKPTTIVLILCGLVFLGFAIEVFGISNTDRSLNPIHKFGWIPQWLGVAAVIFTVISPAPALCSLNFVRSAAKESRSRPIAYLIWTMVVLSVFVGPAESMWTCSGHPTWIQGYGG